jgi:hypothetical protein
MLTLACLLLLASASGSFSEAGQQTGVWQPIEDEILHAMIPTYDSDTAEASKHPDDPAYSPFTAHVAESLRATFGLPGKDYLLVAVQWGKGFCGGCYPTAFGIFDLRTRKLVWRWDASGLHTPPGLKVFRLSPVGSWAFSLRFAEGSQGGAGIERERWLKPVPEGDSLECEEVWSGAVSTANGGNRGGGMELGCGWIAPTQKPGEYEFRQSTFYAAPCSDGEDRPEFFELPCAVRRDAYRKCSPVEIEKVERWVEGAKGLKRISSKTSRIDRAKCEVFPFDLPIRSASLRRTAASTLVFLSANDARLLDSPNKKYRVIFEKPQGRSEVSLFRGGRHLRTIRMQQGDSFDGQAQGLGWTSDSSRFFVVVRFGLTEDRALLSFSVDGQKDYWEKLLADCAAEWNDGFVLEPARPVAKKAGKKK